MVYFILQIGLISVTAPWWHPLGSLRLTSLTIQHRNFLLEASVSILSEHRLQAAMTVSATPSMTSDSSDFQPRLSSFSANAKKTVILVNLSEVHFLFVSELLNFLLSLRYLVQVCFKTGTLFRIISITLGLFMLFNQFEYWDSENLNFPLDLI